MFVAAPLHQHDIEHDRQMPKVVRTRHQTVNSSRSFIRRLVGKKFSHVDDRRYSPSQIKSHSPKKLSDRQQRHHAVRPQLCPTIDQSACAASRSAREAALDVNHVERTRNHASSVTTRGLAPAMLDMARARKEGVRRGHQSGQSGEYQVGC